MKVIRYLQEIAAFKPMSSNGVLSLRLDDKEEVSEQLDGKNSLIIAGNIAVLPEDSLPLNSFSIPDLEYHSLAEQNLIIESSGM